MTGDPIAKLAIAGIRIFQTLLPFGDFHVLFHIYRSLRPLPLMTAS
jgi:hypothetical protein